MAQKKCPFCGENIPSDTQFCLACFQPLSYGIPVRPRRKLPIRWKTLFSILSSSLLIGILLACFLPAAAGTGTPEHTDLRTWIPRRTDQGLITGPKITPTQEAEGSPLPTESPAPGKEQNTAAPPKTSAADATPAGTLFETAPVPTPAASPGLTDYEKQFVLKGSTITKYTGSDATVILPESIGGKPVYNVGTQAFANNTAIQKAVIPEGITVIGEKAFYGCTSLETVEMADSVEQLGNYVFAGCKKLRNVTLSPLLSYLPGYAFYQCESLRSVKLPDRLYSLWDGCFSQTGLTQITLPDNLAEIRNEAFGQCSSLLSVRTGSSLYRLGVNAFAQCPVLQSINLGKKVDFIDFYCFDNSPKVVLTVAKDSYAHSYALKYGIPFQLEEA